MRICASCLDEGELCVHGVCGDCVDGVGCRDCQEEERERTEHYELDRWKEQRGKARA